MLNCLARALVTRIPRYLIRTWAHAVSVTIAMLGPAPVLSNEIAWFWLHTCGGEN